ncbi:hypothetical protein HK098_007513 [Nowakowskiella sp. JEL0407]|nr:hypothetical protein HK098_007513 [Nowakowskiella sp. JEL0407]
MDPYYSPTQQKALPNIPSLDNNKVFPRNSSLVQHDYISNSNYNQPQQHPAPIHEYYQDQYQQNTYQNNTQPNQWFRSVMTPPLGSSSSPIHSSPLTNTEPEEKTYFARRVSRQISSTPNSPYGSLSRTLVPIDLSSNTTSNLTAVPQSPVAVEFPAELMNKSKEEILKSHQKLIAEVNVKNKIIHDLKVKENWFNVQLGAAVKNGKTTSSDLKYGEDFSEAIEGELNKRAGGEDDVKRKLFMTLLHFKKELAKAKTTVEENNNTLRIGNSKRQNLEDEIAHLRNLVENLQSVSSDPSETSKLERARTVELEAKVHALQTENSSLQSKVALWCRASKRNQEARIQAEAFQRSLESEVSGLKSQLEKKEFELIDQKSTFDTDLSVLKSENKELHKELEARKYARKQESSSGSHQDMSVKVGELELVISDLTSKYLESQSMLDHAQSRILEFDQTMQEAVTTVDELERENSGLRTELRNQQLKMEQTAKNTLIEREAEWAELQATARDEIMRVQREKDEVTRIVKGRERQIEELLVKLSELEQELNNAYSMSQMHEKQAETLKIHADTLEKSIQKVQIERESAINALKSLASPSNGFSEDVTSSTAAAAAAANMKLIQEELARERMELTFTKEQLSELSVRFNDLAIDSQKDKDHLNELIENYSRSNEIIESLQSEITKLRAELDSQIFQSESIQTQYLDIQQHVTHIHSQLQSTQFQLEERSNDVEILSSQLKSSESKLRALEAQHQKAEDLAYSLKQQLAERTAELDSMEKNLRDERENLQRTKDELSESEKKVVRLERVISEAAEAVATSSEDDESLTNLEVVQKAVKGNGAVDEKEKEEHETNRRKSVAHARASLSAGMTMELAHLRTQLDAKQQTITELEDKLQVTKEAMDALADELRSSHGTIEGMRRKSIAKEREDFKVKDEIIVSLQLKVVELESKLANFEGRELDQKLSMQRSKIEGQDKKDDAATGNGEVERLRSENEELKQKVESLTTQVNGLKERLQGIADLRNRM